MRMLPRAKGRVLRRVGRRGALWWVSVWVLTGGGWFGKGEEDFSRSGGLVDSGKVVRVVVVRPVRQSVVMWRRLEGRCGLGRGVVVFWGALGDVVMWGVAVVAVLSDAPGDVTT